MDSVRSAVSIYLLCPEAQTQNGSESFAGSEPEPARESFAESIVVTRLFVRSFMGFLPHFYQRFLQSMPVGSRLNLLRTLP